MTRRPRGRNRLQAIVALACLAATPAHAQRVEPRVATWTIEQGVAIPSYAAVEPTTTNLNIDTVVLACEQTRKNRILQLQLYLTDDGPLRPLGMLPEELSGDPRASISIDSRAFPVALGFAEDHAVLADATEERVPVLSDLLVDALQTGQTMTMHLKLGTARPDRPVSFDGYASVDLQASNAYEVVKAMRRCAGPNDQRRSVSNL